MRRSWHKHGLNRSETFQALMDYVAAIDYVDSFINFEKIPQYSYASSFNLDRMRALLGELGDPHQGLKIIHVAGSKGKGSTCAIIASILREAGYRVGLYTSPHLLDVRERIRVEGDIEKKDFIRLIEKIDPSAEKFRDQDLSFFEILTAAAFLYFKEKKVDFAILETGLGGRLDATNVTEPLACGITSISLEHTDKLGDNLAAIAKEKAGIIKKERPVFTVSQRKEVLDVIKEVCREKDAKLYPVQTRCLDTASVQGLSLLGKHQLENASLAIAMVKFIDPKIGEETIKTALKKVDWPGRLQVLQKEPYVILDGAQNTASIKAVLSSIKELFDYKRLICVFGIMSDKDIKGVARELDNASDTVILTRPHNDRAVDPVKLKENFQKAKTRVTSNTREALDAALVIAQKEDLVLVTGSLYLVGEALILTPSVGQV
ncbi:MAG: folylpolyglutamate synthase/dihydrofolate synthase family protein [Candidatus Gorgyraea atricola]|nr:folylpolyglutamate synthase/dihydrofolate synthase family protein [Candidatus Gorgyraea atricola]